MPKLLNEVYARLVARRDALETELAEINQALSGFPEQQQRRRQGSITTAPSKPDISDATLDRIRGWVLDRSGEFDTNSGAEALGISSSLFLKGMRVLLTEENPIVELASDHIPGRRGRVYLYRRKEQQP